MKPETRPGDRLATLAAVAVPLAVYALGACRTVYVGDSGDLSTAVAVLGIPHPSGYPLYVLLGWIWTRALFFLPLPWSLSLFSAACAAAACGALYRVARENGVDRVPSLGAAWLFGFGLSLWGEANVQRVYSLNALFVALALLWALRWRRTGRGRDLVACAFVCGLGASNHLEMAIVGLAVAVFAIASRPEILRRGRLLSACAAAAIVGMLPYVFLPLRSRAHPLLDWGHPSSGKSLLAVVLRSDFWGRAWIQGPRDLFPIAADYAKGLAAESAWVGPALALVALASARRRRWPVLLPLLVMLGNIAAVALHGSRSDIFIWHRYEIPSYLAMALMAGWGWQTLLARVGPRLGGLALLPPLVLLLRGFAPNDRSRYRIAEDYSRTLLAALPPGSQVIASDDNVLFVLMYLNLAEGVRPDVRLILEGVGGALPARFAFNPDTDPVFLTHHPSWSAPGLDALPVGLVFRAWRAGRPWPPPFPVPGRLDGEADPHVPKDYLTRNLIGNFHYMLGVTFERREWPSARREFAEAAAAAPENDVLFYNLGLIYRRDGLLEEALAAFRRSAEINPREIASLSKPRASDKVAEVEAEIRERDKVEAAVARNPGLEGLAPGSPAWHAEMARRLLERGAQTWARRHALAAQEPEAGGRR